MTDYSNGSTTVGTTPTKICTVSPSSDGVLIQNNGSAALFLGGPAVTVSGSTVGISVAAGATVNVPTTGGTPHDLYGVVATGTAAVTYLFPNA
jgi:hypothetical protein